MKRAFIFFIIASAAVACRVDKGGLEPGEGTVFVDIHDNGFAPDTIRVEVGRSVRWTNRVQQQHAVQSETPETFSSQGLFQGWWFQARFDVAGTYDYYCPLHVTALEEPTKVATVIAE